MAHVSGARRPFASARFGIVDTPLQGFYENVGGIELDIEGAWDGDGFGLGLVGLAGDVRISEVLLRGGYQYDGVDSFHKPGLGVGIDDGKVSLDYGVQFYIQNNALILIGILWVYGFESDVLDCTLWLS